MGSVQHTGNGRFRLTYIDYAESKKQGKTVRRSKTEYTYDKTGRKITTTRGNKDLIARRERELRQTVKRLETETWRQCNDSKNKRQQNASGNGALLYNVLTHVIVKKPCLSSKKKTIADAARVINLLTKWIAEHCPCITPAEFSDSQAKKFTSTLSSYSVSTIQTYIRILRSAWNRLAEHLKSEYGENVENVWKKVTAAYSKSIAKQKQKMHYSAFSKDWLRGFFTWLREHNDDNRYELFALLFLTGWRRDDIAKLDVSQLNLEKNYICCTHSKTAETSGATTYLYLTDFMRKTINNINVGHNGKLFKIKIRRLKDILDYYCEHVDKPIDYVRLKVGKYTRRSHSTHAFRRSCITHLKLAEFPESLVNYITGHSGGDIDERHYNKFQVEIQDSTERAMLYLESIITGVTPSLSADSIIRASGMTKEELIQLLQSAA